MKFKRIPLEFITVNSQLPFNVYVKLSEEKAVLLFKKDIIISSDDMRKIKNYPEKKVIIQKIDYEVFFEKSILKNTKKDFIKDGIFDSKKGIAFMKYAFERDEGIDDIKYVENVVKRSSVIIKGLLESKKSKEDKTSLYNILVTMENEDEPFLTHSHKIFAISSMLMMSLPNIEMGYLDDLGYAALLHGYGMQYLSNEKGANLFRKYFNKTEIKINIKKDQTNIEKVISSHFKGENLSSFDDVCSYLKHYYIQEIVLNHARFKTSNGIKKIVSTLKALETPKMFQITEVPKNPYLPAKIFFIADHLVSEVNYLISQNPDKQLPNIMTAGLKALANKKDIENAPLPYDHKIVNHLIDLLS